MITALLALLLRNSHKTGTPELPKVGESIFCTAVWLALFALLLGAQDDFQTQFAKGLKALHDRNFAAAQAGLQAASQLHPSDPHVWVALADTYWKLGKAERAAEAAGKAQKLGAGDSITCRSLAIFYSDQGNLEKAGDIEAGCALANVPDPSAGIRAMRDYLQAGQFKKAIALALALSEWERRADIRNLLGKAYEANGQSAKAIQELQQAVRLKPEEEAYRFDLIELLLRHYDFSGAIQQSEAALKKFPKSAQLSLAAGVAYYGLDRADPAIAKFLQTIALDPSVEQPYLFLSRVMNRARASLPVITQRFAEYQATNPQSYLGYFLYAKALNGQFKEPEHAESLLRKSIALNAEYWESHYELAILLEKRGALEEAEKEFRRTTELNPKEPSPHYRSCRVLAKLGRKKEAQAEAAVLQKVTEEYREDLSRRLATVERLAIRDTDGPK